MLNSLAIVAVLLMTAAAEGATLPSADSARGQRIFSDQSCIQCHSINGQGGKDRARSRQAHRPRLHARPLLVSIMWNHAPTMWAAMEARGIGRPALDEQAAADLFAYFYSARFFDKLGDAGRGKQAFATNHCASCHGITDSKAGAPKPVAQWQSLGSPIDLAEAMWNHAANMRQEFAKQRIRWPDLTSRDLSDILVYVRNLRETQHVAARLETTGPKAVKRCSNPKAAPAATSVNWSCGRDCAARRSPTSRWICGIMRRKWRSRRPSWNATTCGRIVSYLWAEQLLDAKRQSSPREAGL